MLKIGENSYFETIEEAKGLAQEELDPDSLEYQLWESLDDKGKELVIKRGTTDINTLQFKGARAVWKYRLKFPRIINGKEEVPTDIKIAVLLQGLTAKLIRSSEQYTLISKGVKSISVGPDSVSFDTKAFTGVKIYDNVLSYVEPYLKTSGNG